MLKKMKYKKILFYLYLQKETDGLGNLTGVKIIIFETNFSIFDENFGNISLKIFLERLKT